MKLKFVLLSAFIFSSVITTYPNDIDKGKAGLGGGLDVSNRMLFLSSSAIEVQIIDLTTGLKTNIVSVEELETVTDNLPDGEYLLIYIDSNGNVITEVTLLKE